MSIPVISFVAFSNTGKTTFIERLVPAIKEGGLRVAVYKHDGHDFEIDKPGKDSYRMTAAGADVTVISSDNRAAIMENRPVSPEELISRIKNVDLVIVEGNKLGPWPKIALSRKANGKPLPASPSDCIAVITDDESIDCGSTPKFGFDDIGKVAELIMEYIK